MFSIKNLGGGPVKPGLIAAQKLGQKASVVPNPTPVLNSTQPSAAPATEQATPTLAEHTPKAKNVPCESEKKLINTIFKDLGGFICHQILGTTDSLYIEVMVNSAKSEGINETLSNFGGKVEKVDISSEISLLKISGMKMNNFVDINDVMANAEPVKEASNHVHKLLPRLYGSLPPLPGTSGPEHEVAEVDDQVEAESSSSSLCKNSIFSQSKADGNVPAPRQTSSQAKMPYLSVTTEMMAGLLNLPSNPEQEVGDNKDVRTNTLK